MYTNKTCDGCSVNYQTNGLSLDISGGYAQFTDCFGEDYSDSHQFNLCHDCVLRMIELFPVLRTKFGTACHPTAAGSPCCDFGWS